MLVAEDNEVNRVIASDHLESLGFRVDTVENGLQARAARATGVYHWVLMDCHMPQMDGFDAAEAIRADEARHEWNKVPIIALTADLEQRTRDRCLEVGMDGFVAKPFDILQLVAEIEQVLLASGGE